MLALAGGAQAQSLNLYGMTGLLDMPTGESAPDGQLSTTVSSFSGMTRSTLAFQITPRLSGSFRYSALQDCNCFGYKTYFDRSFDLHYQFMDETRWRPAVAVGLRDFVGTGIYSGEYLAATKTLTPNLKLTGGIGWGRLGSHGSFRNPLGLLHSRFYTRPPGFLGSGGIPGINQWFRGPAALFAGVEWQTPIRGLSLKAEYSSDAYTFESGAPALIRQRSPLNFGLDYRLSRSLSFSAYYMYGTAIGIRATLALNPKNPPSGGALEGAPIPVFRRPSGHEPGAERLGDTSWTEQPDGTRILLENLQTLLADEGFAIESAAISGTRAEFRLRNTRYGIAPQAIGRVARAMTRILPISVETFVITPMVEGMAAASITLSRSDIEALENAPDGSALMLQRARFSDPVRPAGPVIRNQGLYPHLGWSVTPYTRGSFFDPGNPIRMDFGLRGQARIDIAPGLSVSGAITKKIVGNLDTITRLSNSVLPHVRSDFGFYNIQGDPALEYLTADYLFQVAPAVYGRLSVGYLERMYGGISGELLWKPVNSRLALGVEANLVRQRDFDTRFGFQSYQVATGHVSAYYDLKNGFVAQVDAGRYLAGDWGATFALDRRFANGWKIGAFFTLTNVSAARFGEGSFDKGIRMTIPLSWITGKPSLDSRSTTIRPVTRDGGARLSVRNRLYPLLERYNRSRMETGWGRFWR